MESKEGKGESEVRKKNKMWAQIFTNIFLTIIMRMTND